MKTLQNPSATRLPRVPLSPHFPRYSRYSRLPAQLGAKKITRPPATAEKRAEIPMSTWDSDESDESNEVEVRSRMESM